MFTTLNELEYATNLLNGGKIECGEKHALSCLAKYYHYYGKDKSQIKQMLNSWYNEHFPDRLQPHRSKEIKSAMVAAEKYPILTIDEIIITKPEIQRILGIKSPKTDERERRRNTKSLQKLAFTLLCFAKFEIAKGKAEPWVNIPYKDLFKFSRVNVVDSLKTQYLKDLINLGLIEHTMKASSYLLKVLFVENGETALTVHNLNETGILFEQVYFGKKYFRCEYCGEMAIMTNGKQKYCRKCVKKANAKKAAENMRKLRAKAKAAAQKTASEIEI